MKFRIYKVTPEAKQVLEYQLEVKDSDAAENWIRENVPHKTAKKESGIKGFADGIHVMSRLILDDRDCWYWLRTGRFLKEPVPIVVGS